MATVDTYLEMQKNHYSKEAARWSMTNKNPVVGGYHKHNAWVDYDEYLFKGIDTSKMIALDYGTGPGRNIIKFHDRFKRIDGVDIDETNIRNANTNVQAEGIINAKLFICNGKSIPALDKRYHMVFSTICLQHIPVHSIRYSIMTDVYRVLKSGGNFCFQMGYGGRDEVSNNFKTYTSHEGNQIFTAKYYDDAVDAHTTNGFYDVSVETSDQLKDDLMKIGFTSFEYDLRPTGPGDTHKQWIFVRATK